MRLIDFFRSKIIIFLIQIIILSFFIYGFGYVFNINFDIDISIERQVIIQFLANYVLFNDLSGLCFIYIGWILISLLPIFLYNNFKKAYSMNLITFFFPNFFLYIFLWRYSEEYFDINFQFHILQTILLGIAIVIFSIVISIILKRITIDKIGTQTDDVSTIAGKIKSICPKCGTKFDSIPRYCYKCNADLSINLEEKNTNER
ncbi:MAG: hypothetical protein ACFFCV_18335 [Promethearchaeota archaeon]